MTALIAFRIRIFLFFGSAFVHRIFRIKIIDDFLLLDVTAFVIIRINDKTTELRFIKICRIKGGNSIKLQLYGLSERTEEINESAARLSRAGAGDERWVVASVGPTGKMLVMGETSENELLDAFKQQSVALARGGADAICIETMSAIDEAALAVQAARDCTECEVICTFTFDRTVRGDYRTMMGVSPADAAKSSVEAGAHIVGANCGNGFAGMIDIVEEIRAASVEVPVLVHANAGIPQNVGGKIVYPETPGQMADLVPDLIKAGANVIGGCCGTTPDHIRAIREAVDRLS